LSVVPADEKRETESLVLLIQPEILLYEPLPGSDLFPEGFTAFKESPRHHVNRLNKLSNPRHEDRRSGRAMDLGSRKEFEKNPNQEETKAARSTGSHAPSV